MLNFLKKFLQTSQMGVQLYVKDARELFFDEVFGSDSNYVRKHKKNILDPVFEQNQRFYQNCSFNGMSDALGVYFGEEVSVRWLQAKAYQQGLAKKDGGALVYVGPMVARKWGVVFEKDLPSEEGLPVDEYIDIDFKKFDPIAEKNKIGSYYTIRFVGDVLRAIDMGYPVVIGRYWPHIQQSSPWILKRDKTKDQAHGTCIIGYDSNYYGFDVDIESNSYGVSWGDKGNFYVKLSELENDIKLFGAYSISPVPYTPKVAKSLIEQIKSLLINRRMEKINEITNKAIASLGTDFTSDAIVPDKVSCAFAVTTLLNSLDKTIPIKTSTYDFWRWLQTSPKFERVYEPQAGDIVISPTGTSTKPHIRANGHTGIYINNNDIVSNSSFTGLWTQNYTRESWRQYYHYDGGYPVYLYRLKNVV